MSGTSRLEQAGPEDGPALLRLIESQSSAGDLDLLYTRRPDPVASILSESARVSLGVIRDENGVPCFMESCVDRRVYLGGMAHTLTYAGNVRKRPGSLGRVNWLRELCDNETVDHPVGFCSILSGNDGAELLLRKPRRAYVPTFTPLCGYRTLLFSPHAIKRGAEAGVIPLAEADRWEVLDFLNREGRNYELFPAVERLEEEFHGLRMEDFYGIRRGGKLVACGALWDQRPFRQYIVKSYGGLYRVAYRLAPLVERLGYIRLPPPGETANVRVLTLLCTEGGDAALLSRMLSGLARAAEMRGCGILVLGVSMGHRRFQILDRVRAISFDSTIFSLEAPGNHQPLPNPEREAHLEVGWL